MSDQSKTTPQEEELIRNIVRVAFGGEFIKLQEDVINLGNHLLKIQQRLALLENRDARSF